MRFIGGGISYAVSWTERFKLRYVHWALDYKFPLALHYLVVRRGLEFKAVEVAQRRVKRLIGRRMNVYSGLQL